METKKWKEEVKREREREKGNLSTESKHRNVCMEMHQNHAEMEYFVLSISEMWT